MRMRWQILFLKTFLWLQLCDSPISLKNAKLIQKLDEEFLIKVNNYFHLPGHRDFRNTHIDSSGNFVTVTGPEDFTSRALPVSHKLDNRLGRRTVKTN